MAIHRPSAGASKCHGDHELEVRQSWKRRFSIGRGGRQSGCHAKRQHDVTAANVEVNMLTLAPATLLKRLGTSYFYPFPCATKHLDPVKTNPECNLQGDLDLECQLLL